MRIFRKMKMVLFWDYCRREKKNKKYKNKRNKRMIVVIITTE